MTITLKRLFESLPAEIRKQDHTEGLKTLVKNGQTGNLSQPEDYGPIRSLLSVMLREGQYIEQDISQLYDDHFIETCADWVVPYIGELVGALALEPIPGTDNHRRFVAATLATRRSKGTLATLEYTASAATGWPIYAIEYWQKLVMTHSQRRPQLRNVNLVNFRDIHALDKIGSPFERTPRTFHARSVETMQGRWNLPNIGLHIFRLKSYRVGNGEIYDSSSTGNTLRNYGYIVRPTHNGSRQYRFHPLRCDAALFRAPPDQEPELGERRTEQSLPMPIRRYEFDAAPHNFFGENKSFHIVVREGATVTPLEASEVKSANLANEVPDSGNESWPLTPDPNITYIDPETGRFILSSRFRANAVIFVMFHEGRAFDIGGYQRELSDIEGLILPGSVTKIGNSYLQNMANFPTGTDPLVFNFKHSTDFRFDGNRKAPNLNNVGDVRIMAMERAWPTLRLQANIGLRLECEPESNLLISGVRFASSEGTSKFVKIVGDDVNVKIRDCTFVPGRNLNRDGTVMLPGAPSIRFSAGQSVTLDRCILGPIELDSDVELILNDCIIDAGSPTAKAIIPLSGSRGHVITLNRCTVIGQIKADKVGGGDHYTEQAQASLAGFPIRTADIDQDISELQPLGIRDSIIFATATETAQAIEIKDIQTGCVRHSFIPPGSVVPRRFACLPRTTATNADWPQFTSRRYLDPGYMQLSLCTETAILEGGSNGSEMGVGNNQNNRARRANLTRIIDDQLRFGFQAGPIYET